MPETKKILSICAVGLPDRQGREATNKTKYITAPSASYLHEKPSFDISLRANSLMRIKSAVTHQDLPQKALVLCLLKRRLGD